MNCIEKLKTNTSAKAFLSDIEKDILRHVFESGKNDILWYIGTGWVESGDMQRICSTTGLNSDMLTPQLKQSVVCPCVDIEKGGASHNDANGNPVDICRWCGKEFYIEK